MHNLQTSAGTALEFDHRAIDEGFDRFVALAQAGTVDITVVAPAIEGLRRHIWVEEEILFPPLRRVGVAGPILVMLREHGKVWDQLDELERLLAQPKPDREEVLVAYDALAHTLAQHNFKEERILYASADRFLDDNSIHQMVSDELDAERPQDWVCAMAAR